MREHRRAEQGGGVATRVIIKMRSAVDEGGESLESFAQVAGTSAEEFAAKFRSAPMEALDLIEVFATTPAALRASGDGAATPAPPESAAEEPEKTIGRPDAD
mgnify:CR=1 FL=1